MLNGIDGYWDADGIRAMGDNRHEFTESETLKTCKEILRIVSGADGDSYLLRLCREIADLWNADSDNHKWQAFADKMRILTAMVRKQP